MMKVDIRAEQPQDFERIFELVRSAFEKEAMSDHQEHFLVERLRQSDAFVSELSLVAEFQGKLVGYILLTKIRILSADDRSFGSLALAPVAVSLDFQKRGIGGQLIEAAHLIAAGLGFGSVVVLGHADYYPKFGYKRLSTFDIRLPFDVPDENAMGIELIEGALQDVCGVVEYPEAFL